MMSSADNKTKFLERKKPLVSISIPTLNESDNIDQLYKRLIKVAEIMKTRCDLEFIFTDNHSDDKTWDKLTNLAKQDHRVKAIRFSKNFGFQRSILANFMHTQGDAVMQIDADLQDPPEMLESFFNEWKKGYHVIYGIRRKRPENIFLKTYRKIGYWLIDALSEYHIPHNAGDFRLIDRKVLNSLLKMNSPNPYLRGMIASLGFNQKGIYYDRDSRFAGKSKFNFSSLLRLGLTAVFNHSPIPLRIASLTGISILGISFFGSLYYLILKLLNPDLPDGLASIHILVLFGIGFQSLLMGIIGEYLLRIFLIIRSEPFAVIENYLNFSQDELKL